jgi:hypothetical protein
MRLIGWKDRSMLDRYAADMQVQRAIEAKRRRGQIYWTMRPSSGRPNWPDADGHPCYP